MGKIGGYGHTNEKDHSFWINLFEKKRFKHNLELSNIMRDKMIDKNVVWWIPKNLMIFEFIK